MTVLTILQNFISIRQKEPCLRRKYVDFQKMLSDPCLNIAEFENVHCLVRKMDPFAYASLYETVSESAFQGCRSIRPVRMVLREKGFSSRTSTQKQTVLQTYCLGIYLCPWTKKVPSYNKNHY